MYKCVKCGKTFESLPDGMIRCPSCAYKILFKQRDPVAKHVKAR